MESNFAKQALPEWQKEHPNARIMRNNTGMAWQGKIHQYTIFNGKTKPQRILANPRPIFFGVGLPIKDKKTGRITQKGGGDYIGWESFKPCDYMRLLKEKGFDIVFECGESCDKCPLKIAVFLSLETKSKDGKESPEQIHFRKVVQAAGGIAIVLKEGE